jgi:hypothetical protein
VRAVTNPQAHSHTAGEPWLREGDLLWVRTIPKAEQCKMDIGKSIWGQLFAKEALPKLGSIYGNIALTGC